MNFFSKILILSSCRVGLELKEGSLLTFWWTHQCIQVNSYHILNWLLVWRKLMVYKMKEFWTFKSIINTIRNHAYNHYFVIEPSQTDYVSLWSFVFTLKFLIGDCFMLKRRMRFVPSVPYLSYQLQFSPVVRKMPKRNMCGLAYDCSCPNSSYWQSIMHCCMKEFHSI